MKVCVCGGKKLFVIVLNYVVVFSLSELGFKDDNIVMTIFLRGLIHPVMPLRASLVYETDDQTSMHKTL